MSISIVSPLTTSSTITESPIDMAALSAVCATVMAMVLSLAPVSLELRSAMFTPAAPLVLANVLAALLAFAKCFFASSLVVIPSFSASLYLVKASISVLLLTSKPYQYSLFVSSFFLMELCHSECFYSTSFRERGRIDNII